MNMTAYIENEAQNNELSRKLIAELKKISESTEFIFGVLIYVENDEDKKTLLEYIYRGEDVNYEQMVLNSLWLSQQREKEE